MAMHSRTLVVSNLRQIRDEENNQGDNCKGGHGLQDTRSQTTDLKLLF